MRTKQYVKSDTGHIQRCWQQQWQRVAHMRKHTQTQCTCIPAENVVI